MQSASSAMARAESPLETCRRASSMYRSGRRGQQLERGLVAAAARGDQPKALVGLADPLRVGVDLGLAEDAAQQLLGLLVLLEPDHHHRVEHLERARPVAARDLAQQLLDRDAEPAGDLAQHPGAGPAVARLDPCEVAVGAAVEREIALCHRALSAQMPDAGAQLAQRFVRIVKFLIELVHAQYPRRSIPGKRIAAAEACKGPRLEWRHGFPGHQDAPIAAYGRASLDGQGDAPVARRHDRSAVRPARIRPA
jgi:hypothetical protein